MTTLGTTPRRCSAFKNAVAEQRKAIEKTNTADEYRFFLANHLDNLGEQYIDQGHPAEGLPHYQEALRLRRELSRTHPENRRSLVDLVRALVALGNIQRHLGDDDAARDLFAEARTALAEPLKSTPGEPELQVELAVVLEQSGRLAGGRFAARKGQERLLEDAAARFREAADRAAPDQRRRTRAGAAQRNALGPCSSVAGAQAAGRRKSRSMPNESTCGKTGHPTNWSTWRSNI